MGVTNNPICEVNKFSCPELNMHCTLDTGNHIEDHARVELANRHIDHWCDFSATQRHEKVDKNGDDHDLNRNSGDNGTKLTNMGIVL